MEPIRIFYHAYLINDWQSLVTDQLTAVVNSGLYQASDCMNIGVVSSGNDYEQLLRLVSQILAARSLPSKIR